MAPSSQSLVQAGRRDASKTTVVPSIQSSIQGSVKETTSSTVGRRVNWYDLSLIDEQDETSRHEAPVQSTSSVERQFPETEGAFTADSVRLEYDSGRGQAKKTSRGKRKW